MRSFKLLMLIFFILLISPLFASSPLSSVYEDKIKIETPPIRQDIIDCIDPIISGTVTEINVYEQTGTLDLIVTGVNVTNDLFGNITYTIIISVNGTDVIYTYDPNTGVLTTNYPLTEGDNIIIVTALNDCGVVSDTIIVTVPDEDEVVDDDDDDDLGNGNGNGNNGNGNNDDDEEDDEDDDLGEGNGNGNNGNGNNDDEEDDDNDEGEGEDNGDDDDSPIDEEDEDDEDDDLGEGNGNGNNGNGNNDDDDDNDEGEDNEEEDEDDDPDNEVDIDDEETEPCELPTISFLDVTYTNSLFDGIVYTITYEIDGISYTSVFNPYTGTTTPSSPSTAEFNYQGNLILIVNAENDCGELIDTLLIDLGENGISEPCTLPEINMLGFSYANSLFGGTTYTIEFSVNGTSYSSTFNPQTGATSSDFPSIIEMDVNGNLYLIVTASNLCGDAIDTIFVDLGQGNSNGGFNLQEEEINIYPIPATEFIYVNYVLLNDEDEVSFQLIDANGQVQLNVDIIESRQKVDVSQLQRGVYFYQIISNGVKIKSSKLVLQ